MNTLEEAFSTARAALLQPNSLPAISHIMDTLRTRVDALLPDDCDVRKILLEVVPGDGDGFEVYPKSVADVEAKLCDMGTRLEEWELGIRRLPATPSPREGMAAILASRQKDEDNLARSMLHTQIRNAITDIQDGDEEAAIALLKQLVGDE